MATSQPKLGRTAVARRRQLVELTGEIRGLKATVARDLYEIGRRLLHIQREELWRDGGDESLADYLERGTDIAVSTGYRFMRVAEHFNADIARRFGVTKLLAAVRYVEVTPADERPGDILAARIRVRQADGRFRLVPLVDASAKQIDRAIALLLEAKRGGMQVPPGTKGRVQRLEKALPAPPRGLGGPRVRVVRAKDGRLAFSFRVIPEDNMIAFARALLAEWGA